VNDHVWLVNVFVHFVKDMKAIWLYGLYAMLPKSLLAFSLFRPELRCEYVLNLSISVSTGKETNEDSDSNGE
jgi:hypothetical protein